MKNILKNIGEFFGCFLLLAALVVLCNLSNGCDDVRHHRHYSKKTQQTVTVYKTHKHHSSVGTVVIEDDNDWLYWYVFSENNTYYYYSSPTYYSPAQYQTFTWTPAQANPIPTANEENEVQSVEQQTVSNDELGQQMEQTIDTTEQQIADMVDEGNPNSGGYDTDSTGGESDSGSSGGSDSGSSGGDSGGGDGGGGGD